MLKLVDKEGKIEFGHGPVDEINYLDFDLRNTMDKPLSRWRKKFKFNQFQFISISSPEFVIGLAIVDLKYASNCFVYLYHIDSQTFEEFDFIQPLAINTEMATSPNQGVSQFIQGKNTLLISAKHEQRHIHLTLNKGFSIDAHIKEAQQNSPLSLCSKAGYNGWVYTHKNTALPIEGKLSWQNKQYDFKSIKALASVDWSAGFMRRETSWHWGSLSCYLEDGRRLGFNLASGVNETGFSENGIWLEGKCYKVDMVDFQFDRYQENQTWQLKSNDGKIALTFSMQGKRAQKMNLILIASNFRQFFGQFNGKVTLNNETILIKNAWGLVEDHYAKW